MLPSYCWKPAFKVFKAKLFHICNLYYYDCHKLSKVVHTTSFVGTKGRFSPARGMHSKAHSSHMLCGLSVTEHKLVLVEVRVNLGIAKPTSSSGTKMASINPYYVVQQTKTTVLFSCNSCSCSMTLSLGFSYVNRNLDAKGFFSITLFQQILRKQLCYNVHLCHNRPNKYKSQTTERYILYLNSEETEIKEA